MNLRAVRRAVAFALLLFVSALVAHAETPIPPAPTEWVTDNASLLSAQTVAVLNARLQACETQTGHQVLTYIATTTGGAPLEDWTVAAFAKWKVGRKGLDDGLVLFLFTQDRTVRIEVGYGLEPKVPDVLASRIIRDTIVPGLQAGNPDLAITSGLDKILVLVGCEAAVNVGASSTDTGGDQGETISLTPFQWFLIGLGLLVLLIFAIRSPWLALYLLVNIVGGGGSGGGGGFSGGGGRSGGGGASGRW